MPLADASAYNGYRPTFSDSARAGARLSEDFMQSFKQSLLTDYGDLETANVSAFGSEQLSSQLLMVDRDPGSGTSATDGARGDGDQCPTMGRSDIAYPLSLYDYFPELPSVEVTDHLNQVFEDGFLRRVPFFRDLSAATTSGLASTSGLPVYLAFSKALVATLFCSSRRYRRWSWNLYISAVKTFVGAVEFDNRTSRNHFWFQAGILLVTFGTLQSNTTIWHTINMLNGYFFAPYKRCGLLDMRFREASPEHLDLGIFTSFYFLVDLLRAVHTSTPPSVNPSVLSFPVLAPEGCSHRFEDIYQGLILLHQPLDSALGSDGYLLGLLCILSETFLLLQFLGPLVYRNFAAPGLTVDNQIQMLRQPPLILQECQNTVPLSGVSREYLLQIESLKKSLMIWHHSVRSPAPLSSTTGQYPDSTSGPPLQPSSDTVSLVEGGVLALAYFCRILLETGPQVLALPQAYGYPQRKMFGGTATDGVASGPSPTGVIIQVNDVAMECAWKILDVCDAYDADSRDDDHEDSPGRSKSVPPIWLPLVTFYAGLIVWCRMQDHGHDKSVRTGIENSDSARRRIMMNYHGALRKMGRYYECAKTMADCLENLHL